MPYVWNDLTVGTYAGKRGRQRTITKIAPSYHNNKSGKLAVHYTTDNGKIGIASLANFCRWVICKLDKGES